MKKAVFLIASKVSKRRLRRSFIFERRRGTAHIESEGVNNALIYEQRIARSCNAKLLLKARTVFLEKYHKNLK